jgi:hypothetical protein
MENLYLQKGEKVIKSRVLMNIKVMRVNLGHPAKLWAPRNN